MIRPHVLVLNPYFLPGYKSGGPQRSLINLIHALSGDFDFSVLTADRDLGDTRSYGAVPIGHWHQHEGIRMRHEPPDGLRLRRLARTIRETPHDLLYLNGLYAPRLTIAPLVSRRIGRLHRRPVVLAPRGALTRGARGHKRWKKAPFLRMARHGDLYRGVTFQASTKAEATDIREVLGVPDPLVHVAPDLSICAQQGAWVPRESGAPLRVLFLSRVVPHKNLSFAAEVLARTSCPVALTVAGPVEDAAYAEACKRGFASLAPRVQVVWTGPVPPSRVAREMAAHDLFLLPTKGENHGHVIAEALSAGTPVLISNRTPWHGLAAAGAGAALSLDAPEAFAEIIEAFAVKSPSDLKKHRGAATRYLDSSTQTDADITANRAMFLAALTPDR